MTKTFRQLCAELLQDPDVRKAYEEIKMTKLTEADIVSRIIETRYIQDGTMIICVCRLQNGFRVVGTSACVDPEQYNAEIGERMALENAKDQIWQLEGYLLKEQMWREAQP